MSYASFEARRARLPTVNVWSVCWEWTSATDQDARLCMAAWTYFDQSSNWQYVNSRNAKQHHEYSRVGESACKDYRYSGLVWIQLTNQWCITCNTSKNTTSDCFVSARVADPTDCSNSGPKYQDKGGRSSYCRRLFRSIWGSINPQRDCKWLARN